MFRPSAQPPATGGGPEWELLLCSARSSLDDGSSERIRGLVRRGVDWDRLVELASKHHVLPLLYRSLSTACPDSLPPATLDWLDKVFASNVARNLAIASELLALLKWLAAHEVAAIPFKGPTLASLAYGGLALRQSGDLDILVRRPDAIRAKRLLMSRGFRPYQGPTDDTSNFIGLPDDQELDRGHHFIMVRDDRPISVEIHWRLIDDFLYFNLSEEDLWRGVSSTRVAGVPVPCFPTPELLIYLCAHGTKHCWERLSWICDIAELIRAQGDLDWELVMRKARAIGAERMLSLGLLLASDLLGAPLTDAIAGKIAADATARGLAREVLERYFRETDSPPAFAEMLRFNVRARERRRDRLRCRFNPVVIAFKPNERDLAFLDLPPRFSFLYRGVKPVRLATKYALDPRGFLRLIGDLTGFRKEGRPPPMASSATRPRVPPMT